MTATNKREFRFENDGRTFDGYIGDKHIVRSAYVSNKDAAKDNAFEKAGYDVSPIDDFELTEKELSDTSKVRRFLWFDGMIYIPEMIDLCIIDSSGNVSIPDDMVDYDALAKYMTKHYMKDVEESIKKRSLASTNTGNTLDANDEPKASTVIAGNNSNGTSGVLHTVSNPVSTTNNSRNSGGATNAYYIPDDAGFNATGGLMSRDQDGNYYLNINNIVDPTTFISGLQDGLAHQSIPQGNVGPDQILAYNNQLGQWIQSTVNNYIANLGPEVANIVNADDILALCNNIFNDAMAGDPEEVSRRISNPEELDKVLTKSMGVHIGVLVEKMCKNAGFSISDLVEKVAIEQPVAEQPVLVEEPVEEDILGEEPVDNTDLKAKYPILDTVEKLLLYNTDRGVKFIQDENSKLITAAVFPASGTDDNVIKNASIVMDIDGSIFTPDKKFWAGVCTGNDKPDVKACYELTEENLVKFRDGKPMQYLVKPAVSKLNKYVDIRTLYNFIGGNKEIDESLAGDIVTETKREIMPNDKINRNYAKSRGCFTGCKKLNDNTFEFTIEFPETYPKNLGEEATPNGGTGNLVVKVTTSEKTTTRSTVTK